MRKENPTLEELLEALVGDGHEAESQPGTHQPQPPSTPEEAHENTSSGSGQDVQD